MIWPMTRVSVPVNPFNEFGRLYRDMDRLFGDYSGRTTFPAVNVWGDENEAVVSVEIPGVDPKDVKLSVEENILTIDGERKAETFGESDIQVRRERPTGRFTRSLRLPFEVEADKIIARYENGLLNVRLPRREATKPRKIEIAVG
jgi:HSP20 family protein